MDNLTIIWLRFGNLNRQNFLYIKKFLLSLFSSISKSFWHFICTVCALRSLSRCTHSDTWRLVAHSSSHQGKPPLFPTQAAFVVNIAVLWHHDYRHKVCAASKNCIPVTLQAGWAHGRNLWLEQVHLPKIFRTPWHTFQDIIAYVIWVV